MEAKDARGLLAPKPKETVREQTPRVGAAGIRARPEYERGWYQAKKHEDERKTTVVLVASYCPFLGGAD